VGTKGASVVDKAAAKVRELAVNQALEGLVADNDIPDLGEDEAREAIRAIAGIDSVRFRLSKVSGPAEERGAIAHLSVEELDPVEVGERYGPGEYVVRGIDQAGKFVKGTAGRFSVSRSIKRRSELERPLRERDLDRGSSRDFWAAIGPSLVTVGGSIATALIGRPDNTLAIVAALSERRSGGVSDDILKALVLKQFSGSGEKSHEFLDAALKLAERINAAPSAGEGESVWSMIAQALKGIAPAAAQALANRQAAPSAPQPNTLAPMAATGALPPKPIVLRQPSASSSPGQPSTPGAPLSGTVPQAQGSQVPPPPPVSPGMPANGSSTSAAMELDASQRAMLAIAMPWLRRQAENLVQWAEAELDARLACDTLTNSLPKLFAEHVPPEQFLEWLNRQDWWTQLVEFEPAITPHQSWCVDVRAELIEYFEEERASVPESESQPERPADGR
jgi:hypothetical protein